MSFEVETPIINSPFAEPTQYWQIRHGETPVLAPGRRKAVVYQPPDQRAEWDLSDGSLVKAGRENEGAFAGRTYEMVLVNRIRERVNAWRAAGYPGATRTSRDLLDWWHRDGQQYPLFFAQREAAATIVFLKEARADLLQGISVPHELLSEDQIAAGAKSFQRYACKMATGSGKTTVMGMLAAWSILNKVADRGSAIHSDAVLVICPNVTIRDRLRELDPTEGEASIYATRKLVPPEMLPQMARGRVFVTNWHTFEPQGTQGGSRVVKAGVRVETQELVTIGDRNTTARGSRYMTKASYDALVHSGDVVVKGEEHDGDGNVKKARIVSWKYVESDSALIKRVLERELGKKQHLLVFNDEAHHAYRIRPEADESEAGEESVEEGDEDLTREATVWVEGLDRVQEHRGINFCVDLSATPYFLARVGRETARPFPWTVSDFGLVDAIESGLVKIPQLPARDTTGLEQAPYFNIWEWVKSKLTGSERGGRAGGFKPEAVLKWASQPIMMLAGEWRATLKEWREERQEDRPPVFIIVCKDTKLAKVAHDWIADDVRPEGIPSLGIAELRNSESDTNTIRVDSKVVAETDASGGESGGGAKADEQRWMRFTLDTIGKRAWPSDKQGRDLYPPGFEELARKLKRPLTPPGKAVRCIVSVGMLTEGWDCNTVTHIIGLRPFMSQLLCEQVVGRALRRASYDTVGDGRLFAEETAQVFGVPFEVIPFKGAGDAAAPKVKRFNVKALEDRVALKIEFPRVIGYTQAVRNRVTVDWSRVPKLVLKPGDVPTIVATESLTVSDDGRITTQKFGKVKELTMAPYRIGKRFQEGVFLLARDLTRQYGEVAETKLPAHVLFPQLRAIADRFARDFVVTGGEGSDALDLFTAPYYGWALDILRDQIHPDQDAGEAPELPRVEERLGSTSSVDFWTSRPVREVEKSHVNYVVADTARWEQQAAFYINRHKGVAAFVKNSGLDFRIPYHFNGQPHDFIPDFIIKLAGAPNRHFILETKGYDELAEVKEAAAKRWVAAVNAAGQYGEWSFAMARKIEDVSYLLTEISAR